MLGPIVQSVNKKVTSYIKNRDSKFHYSSHTNGRREKQQKWETLSKKEVSQAIHCPTNQLKNLKEVSLQTFRGKVDDYLTSVPDELMMVIEYKRRRGSDTNSDCQCREMATKMSPSTRPELV